LISIFISSKLRGAMTSPCLLRPRSLLLTLALATLGCGDDGAEMDGSGTETTASSTEPSTSTPSTSAPSTTDPPTSTDPTGTDATTTTGDTDSGESSSTGTPGVCAATPGEWSASNWAKNVVAETTLRTALAELVGDTLMRGAETGAATVDDITDLTGPFEAGDPSLASITSPGYQPIVDDAFEEFVELIAAGEQDLIDAGGLWAPGAAGGIWGDNDRGIDEGGLEVRQLVDKGLFSGGAFYGHAVALTEGEIDEATIDRIAYIWGNNEMLDPKAMLDDAASYGWQQGFHADMAAALIAAKAYTTDVDCGAERDAALQEFFTLWETSMMSRLVFYMSETALGLAGATADTAFADALHELAEGIGLAAGFYGLPDPAAGPLSGGARVITDEDLELMLGALGVDLGDLGLSTTGLFVESLPNYEDAQDEAEGVIMDVYGVDAATLATWRMPTPG
jgi:hypothetical protein